MKRICVLLLFALLIVASVIPAAATEWADKEFTSTLDDFPTWLSKAETVEFEEYFESGKTNARNGATEFGQGYVYLKEDGKGDFTVPFTVKEDGIYDIAVLLMAWTKSVPRSSQFKIDDSEWIYICFEYTEDNQYAEQYIYDITLELAKGDHTFTIGLADDFDDSTVKSLYFDSFSYLLKEAKAEETTAPAEETTAPAEETTAPAEETTAPAESETAQAPAEDTAAPQTSDFVVIAAIAAVVSLAGFAISRKK